MTTMGVERVATDLTRQKNVKPVDGEVFNDGQSSYTSLPIDCDGYRKFLLRITLAVEGAPTDIKINVQFSHAGGTYENYTHGPFGSLMYEDSAGAKSECIDGECLGAKMKINVVATGVDAVKTFTLTCKVILTR